MKTSAPPFPVVEILETRIALAVHEWTGGGADNLWSNAQNWTNGSPATDASGDIDLIFHTNLTNAAQLVMQNDIAALTVDSITFDANAGTNAAGGTSANGYTINGNAITIKTGAAGQDPFGIDIANNVADSTSGITEIFNVALTLSTNDATFRSQQVKSLLTFHGDIDLGGRTLTISNTTGAGNNANTPGVLIDGDISTGNLIKTGSGTLELSGDNSFTNFTSNGGFTVAKTNTALGTVAGSITTNDPGQVQLRNGITVQKTTFNLNSNSTGGGLGADGGATNTFQGSLVLMAGNGGVALGAGFPVAGDPTANTGTRLVVDGVISGATSTLFINGNGIVEFTHDNTYTGQTNLNGNQGPSTLQIDTPAGLGAGGGGNELIVSSGNSVLLNFDGTLRDAGSTAEVVQFAGKGVGSLGAIRVIGDHDAVLAGNLTLIAGAPWTLGVDGVNSSLTTTGVIDSQAANRGLTKVGAGTLIIGGAGANTFVGGVTVNGGLLDVTNTTATPLGSASGAVIVNGASTLLVETGVNLPNVVGLTNGATLTGIGTASSVISASSTISPGTNTGRFTANSLVLDAASDFVADIHGTTAATTHDQFRATASVILGGATLTLVDDFTANPGDQFRIIDNTSSSAVNGTFAGLPEGAKFTANGQGFQISYVGGTGNDVVLTALATPANDLAVSGDGKSAIFTDGDGDVVTVKIKGKTAQLAPGDFTFGFSTGGHAQLLKLALDPTDAGATLTITSKRTAAGGDGLTNIGYLNATGVALGSVVVDGDLGRIDAGAVKALTVQSLGALGLTTQGGTGSLVSNLTGNLGRLTVKASIHDASVLGTGSIGAVAINGSFLGGRLSAGADLGTITVRGDIAGTAASPVIISAFGKAVAPTKGLDVAIKSLKVLGGVDFLRVLAGYDLTLAALNADASISSIFAGADWHASTALAGTTAGADGFAGTADDAKIVGTRDNAKIFSTIASVTIRGQASGTIAGGDTFGIVAEQITKAKVAKAALKFDKGPNDAADAFAFGATGPGATGLTSDFFLREVTL